MIAKRGPTAADRLDDRYWRFRKRLSEWFEEPDISRSWRRVDDAICGLVEAIEKHQQEGQ